MHDFEIIYSWGPTPALTPDLFAQSIEFLKFRLLGKVNQKDAGQVFGPFRRPHTRGQGARRNLRFRTLVRVANARGVPLCGLLKQTTR